MICIPDTYPFAHLNCIYHSTSMHEMKIKADLYNVDLTNDDVLCYLIDTTTYHHAYWPHTAKRFSAFKSLLRSLKRDLGVEVLLFLKDHALERIENMNKWSKCTPGGKQEIKNLKQVIKILDNIFEKKVEQMSHI